MRENRVRSLAEVDYSLAPVSPNISLIREPMVGLRIVATSTRVRLFPFPVRLLRATAFMHRFRGKDLRHG